MNLTENNKRTTQNIKASVGFGRLLASDPTVAAGFWQAILHQMILIRQTMLHQMILIRQMMLHQMILISRTILQQKIFSWQTILQQMIFSS